MIREHRVHAWVATDWEPAVVPLTRPAVRVWGDVLLELVSERQGRVLQPAIEIRRTSLLARPSLVPLREGPMHGENCVPVELTVDPGLCAVARVDVGHELSDPIAWRRLREWLADRGHDQDYVEEELVAVTDPGVAMFVARGRQAVESTGPGLLTAVLDFFEQSAIAYLDSWTQLTLYDDSAEAATQIVVPPAAIQDVRR